MKEKLLELLACPTCGGDILLANAGKHATIGLTYKSRTKLNLAGEADFDVPAAFASQPLAFDRFWAGSGTSGPDRKIVLGPVVEYRLSAIAAI